MSATTKSHPTESKRKHLTVLRTLRNTTLLFKAHALVNIVYLQYSSIIPGGVARAPNRNILYLLYGHYSTSKRMVAGSIPDSSIFLKKKRFKNSWRNDLLTLAATRYVMPSTVAKKIFKADHHARRRIKNMIPGAFRC